jgi:hypothetical protein
MELIFTVGIMVFLGIAAFFSNGLSKDSVPGDVLGAQGFPLLVIAVCFLLCAFQIVRQAREKHTAREKLLDLSTPAGRAILFTALTLAGYVAVLNILGFILSTFVFALVSAVVMGYGKKGKLVTFAAIATAALFLLFGKAFFVPLPRGIGFLKELSYLLY